MPLIVDHEERRREVAAVAASLIVRSGLEKVSVREIARAAGYSTAVVSHYFHNKRELLLCVYQLMLGHAEGRVAAALAAGKPAGACLEELLPIDERRRDEWKIWFAFWGTAMSDPHFMDEQKQRGRSAQKLIAHVLDEASDIPADSGGGRDFQSRRLLVMVAGLATQATYDPAGWPPERQRAVLAAELDSLGPPPPARPGSRRTPQVPAAH
jgi:AcrR family transcriptional regulator